MIGEIHEGGFTAAGRGCIQMRILDGPLGLCDKSMGKQY